MSVLLETTLGNIVIDLYTKKCPNTSMNFLKLCKVKYYNFCCFHNVQKDYMIQTGDPTATGKGGESIFSLLTNGKQKYFPPEIHPKLNHLKKGTVSMAVASFEGSKDQKVGLSGSQFFITMANDLEYLDGKYTVFGQVYEGFDVLDKINESYCDDNNRPFRDIRIKHTYILDDPFPDPQGLQVPDKSPLPSKEMLATVRIAEDEELESKLSIEEQIKVQRQKEAKAQALTLEMLGDIPFAEVKAPENVLFVCKLNPVTLDEDLELIFSRFGTIVQCEIIRDKVTNDSLSYAFIEFQNRADCETAYFKMDGALIDDRRIHVDFSQSVSKLNKDWSHKIEDNNPQSQKPFLKGSSNNDYDLIFDDDCPSDKIKHPSNEKNHKKHKSRQNKKSPPSRKTSSNSLYTGPQARSFNKHHLRSPKRRKRSCSPKHNIRKSKSSRSRSSSRRKHN